MDKLRNVYAYFACNTDIITFFFHLCVGFLELYQQKTIKNILMSKAEHLQAEHLQAEHLRACPESNEAAPGDQKPS